MLSIHTRPPEIENRQFPGHWEAISSRERSTPSERHFGRAHQPAGDAVQTGGPNNVALIVHPLSWRVQVTCMFTIDATLPQRG